MPPVPQRVGFVIHPVQLMLCGIVMFFFLLTGAAQQGFLGIPGYFIMVFAGYVLFNNTWFID